MQLDRGSPPIADDADPDDVSGGAAEPADSREVTPAQALWRAAGRFRSIALQPLDLCPPCDIQFVDYARAMLRNHIMTDPVDRWGYRPIMLNVFHRRGLCLCGRRPDEPLPADCEFFEVVQEQLADPTGRLIGPQMARVAGSRTAAYYFLTDNRSLLRIPPHQDIQVCDLYDNFKMSSTGERLPREIVLEYLWEEEVLLENDPAHGLDFGGYAGQAVALQCGGTLVFDERGSLLSWFHKPGTEHITAERAAVVRAKAKPTRLERAELKDLDLGARRKEDLLRYTAAAIKAGLVGETKTDNPLLDRQRPIAMVARNGLLHLEVAPHLRKSDFDREVAGWPVSY
jgi:hypothetical protein